MFPTPKVVANVSPIRQIRLKDMLTVADNVMKQLVFSVFKHADGGLLAVDVAELRTPSQE